MPACWAETAQTIRQRRPNCCQVQGCSQITWSGASHLPPAPWVPPGSQVETSSDGPLSFLVSRPRRLHCSLLVTGTPIHYDLVNPETGQGETSPGELRRWAFLGAAFARVRAAGLEPAGRRSKRLRQLPERVANWEILRGPGPLPNPATKAAGLGTPVPAEHSPLALCACWGRSEFTSSVINHGPEATGLLDSPINQRPIMVAAWLGRHCPVPHLS